MEATGGYVSRNVPKRRHIKFRRRGINQTKAYSIQNTKKFEIKNNGMHIQGYFRKV